MHRLIDWLGRWSKIQATQAAHSLSPNSTDPFSGIGTWLLQEGETSRPVPVERPDSDFDDRGPGNSQFETRAKNDHASGDGDLERGSDRTAANSETLVGPAVGREDPGLSSPAVQSHGPPPQATPEGSLPIADGPQGQSSNEIHPVRTLRLGDLAELPTNAPSIGRVRELTTPRSLAALPWRPPSVQADGVMCGNFYVGAGSHAGLAHLSNGTPRQDSYDFALRDDGCLVVAVADGMGSRPFSQVGARLFTEQVNLVAATKPGLAASRYISEAVAKTAHIAKEVYDLEHEAISFVAAVAVFDPKGCQIARVGDVTAFVTTETEDFLEVFPYAADSALNMAGAGLPSAELPEERFIVAQRVVLTTDGLAADIRSSMTVRSWLSEIWKQPTTGSLMTEALRYRRQGSHDDRTAVVVWRRSGELLVEAD